MNFLTSNPCRTFFLLWAAACIIILPCMSFNAGITEDEPQHMLHGKSILAWYEGKDSTAQVSPFARLTPEQMQRTGPDKIKTFEQGFLFDSNEVWKAEPHIEDFGSKTAINIYGGLFDSFAALIYEKVTSHLSLGEFESKHILSALMGALLLIFTGLICLVITDSWLVALLGIIIATFTPRLIGNSLSNPKDIPQATMFAFSILQMLLFLKELPAIKIRRLFWVALSFSLAMAIRSGAIILIAYFLSFTCFYIIILVLLGEISINRGGIIILTALATSVAGYLCTCIFWPWDMLNPVLNPLRSLAVFKNFDVFDAYEIFEGHWLFKNELPWYFVPKWLYITMPLTVIFGVLLFFVQLPRFFQKGGFRLLSYTFILFSAVFPVFYIIISHSNIYNSARHVLFVVPSIIVIATFGWAELFAQIKNGTQQTMVRLAFLCLLYEPIAFIIDNNPVQAMYFSPAIGGETGAFKNYEMDYWGYSLRPAIEWLDKTDSIQIPGKKLRVRMYYGEQLKLSYYVDKSKNLAYALCREDSPDWDYELVLPADSKHDHDMLYHWPPPGTVYEVKTEGIPLCAVVKSSHAQPASSSSSSYTPPITPGQPVDSVGLYLGFGIDYYNKNNYNMAIVSFKKALSYNTTNTLVLNNLVATYNNLKMFDEAVAYGKKGLALKPDFELLKNNLAASVKAIGELIPDEAYYQNLSYNYFVQGEYQKTIEASKKQLKLNPNSAAAWNNICSAYNALKQYQKAMEACDKGLQIDAKSELLKNNRNEAVKALGSK